MDTFRSLVLLHAFFLQTLMYSAAQDDDENKPYEFGFNIEGYQHRHEKRGENNIIEGEFGFVTADGVYHETKYATDENGNFRIISMKNTFIGLPMTSKETAEPSNNVKVFKTPKGKPGCGGCLIPTTEAPLEKPTTFSSLYSFSGTTKYVTATPLKRSQHNIKDTKPFSAQPKPNAFSNGLNNILLSTRSTPFSHSFSRQKQDKKYLEMSEESSINQPVISADFLPQPLLPMATSVPAASQQIPKISLAKHLLPNKYERRPPIRDTPRPNLKLETKSPSPSSNVISVQEKPSTSFDSDNLYYKYNYTLTYHGHHENGNRAGNKQGSYSVSHPDGTAYSVQYLSNEFGFQPNISFTNTQPEDRSRSQPNELKGFEFKWFQV